MTATRHDTGSPAKSSLCYVSTPEHLESFQGRFLYIYTGIGELRLDAENLSFHRSPQAVTIPLAAIRKLAQGSYPLSAKPYPLHYIAVTFKERGAARTLLFTPVRAEAMLPWDANVVGEDWLAALREAIRVRTGEMPPVEQLAGAGAVPPPGVVDHSREKTRVVAATVCFVALFTAMLGVVMEFPRQAAGPIIIMAFCGIGLAVCFMRLAGHWPFSIWRALGPSFSSRNLAIWKYQPGQVAPPSATLGTAGLLGTTRLTPFLGWGTAVVLAVSLLVFTLNPFGLPKDGLVFQYYYLAFFTWMVVVGAELFIRALRTRATGPRWPRLLLMGIMMFSFVTCLTMVVGTARTLLVVRSDYVGRSWFPRGDSIAIDKVYRMRDQLVMEGHYALVSTGKAQLALSMTSTNDAMPTDETADPLQQMRISRGRGNFKLFHALPASGLPHVSMYDGGQSFAELYFGTKAEALAESTSDQIEVEHLALRMLAAIRDKDDKALKALATDRIQGWGEALPQFASGMREEFQQMRGRPFGLRVAETDLQGDAALVKCDDPQEPNRMYLVLFFARTGAGWKNWYLHNAPPNKPLQDFWKQMPTTTNGAGQEQGQTLGDLPPVIVETQPVSGVRDVTPGTVEIRARFSKEMTDASWSWGTAWLNSAPEIIGKPRFESDHRTCVAKMKLEPGRTYAIWLNSESYHNFKDLSGQPAVPYLMIFQTKSN